VQHLDGPPEHPEVRTEKTDANFRWIVGLLIVSLVLAGVVHYVILVYFLDYRRYQDDIKQSPFPLAAQPSEALPREPRLEQVDRMAGITRPDVYRREAAKEEILRSVGDTNEPGYVHIPIDDAMDQLAKKLPARAAPPADAAARDRGLLDAGESNSGRVRQRGP
jgi:hypothetical protein